MAFMRPLNHVIVDGKSLSDFGVYVSGDGTFNAPERDYVVTEVPGRSGDLYYDNGRFKNRTLTYTGWIDERTSVNLEGLRNYLYSKPGYRRIEDSYHKNEYYMGYYVGPFEPSMVMLTNSEYGGQEVCAFDLSFSCKPQRFLKTGEQPIEITEATFIKNPTYFPAKPLIRVYGNGKFKMGDVQCEIKDSDYEYVMIDCELYECYYKDLNANSKLIFENDNKFPVLNSGNNYIYLGDGISKLIVVPRWWII